MIIKFNIFPSYCEGNILKVVLKLWNMFSKIEKQLHLQLKRLHTLKFFQEEHLNI